MTRHFRLGLFVLLFALGLRLAPAVEIVQAGIGRLVAGVPEFSELDEGV